MRPVLFRIAGIEVPTHEAFVLLGIGTAVLLFWREARRRGLSRELWPVAAGALLGGALLAKAATAWR